MAYGTIYRSTFSNEQDELVTVLIKSKDGLGVIYSASSFFTYISPTQFSFTALSAVPEIVIGNNILVDGNEYVMTGVSFDSLAGIYTITIGAGGVDSGIGGLKVFYIKGDTGGTILEELKCEGLQININGDGGDIYDPVRTRELLLQLHVPVGSGIQFDTFVFSQHDDWFISVDVDGELVFEGFLIPDESPLAMQDKPWSISLHATDCLKLLSKQTLAKADGTEFNSKHSLIEYISAILSRTEIPLPIWVYCNIYYNPMYTRADDPKWDMFSQIYLDYRTFMKSSTEFVDCYTALQIIFKKHFFLAYDNGRWIIYRIPEYQYLADNIRYYTIYNSDGTINSGGIDTTDYSKVGKLNITKPIEETQIQSALFANKTVRNDFKYNTWEEIPRNNKFERGTLTASGTAQDETDIDGDGDFTETIGTYKRYTIDNWDFGKVIIPVNSTNLPFPVVLGSSSKAHYTQRVYNNFGVELRREVFIEATDTDANNWYFLQSEGIPVRQGDIIGYSGAFRSKNNAAFAAVSVGGMYLVSKDGTFYYGGSNSDFNFPVGPKDKILWAKNKWYPIFYYYNGEDMRIPVSVNMETNPMPIDGTLYFVLPTSGNSLGGAYFSNFGIEYKPFVSGGFIPIKGDYWTRTQAANYPDSASDEVQISDSLLPVTKGTLWYKSPLSGIFDISVQDWYRYGLGGSEIRHYKELVNLGEFNLTQRRYLKVEGDFNGTKYQVNNDLTIKALSFIPRYGFEDRSPLRLFALIPPVKIDYYKGWFNATFQEVYKDVNDGTQEGSSSEFKYLFE